MVRSWTASERLLGVVAVAYARVGRALHSPRLAHVRTPAATLLKQRRVVGDRRSAGSLADGISVDYAGPARA